MQQYHVCCKLDNGSFVELNEFQAGVNLFSVLEIEQEADERRKHDAEKQTRPRRHDALLPRAIQHVLTRDTRQEDLVLRLRGQLHAAEVVPEGTLLLEQRARVVGLRVVTLVQHFHRELLKLTKRNAKMKGVSAWLSMS